ncbi:protein MITOFERRINLIKE 1, chloroplastic [Ananas comosus]|uniref:Protein MITOFERRINLIKE 1, chloroplastic n=1 Tax=Ananas comosus TaxID=4615 RepID=A0A6P5GTA0_ANACO|nr:protein MITOFERRINLIKE 1, chloroplastic [Ananas comosus]
MGDPLGSEASQLVLELIISRKCGISFGLLLKPSSSSERSLLSPLDRAAIGALAGAFAGGLTYVALLPLDAVKTRLQTLPSSSASASSAVAAASSILRSHGPLGFYRGLSAVLLGSAASSALYFATCELAKSLLHTLTLTLNPFFVPPLAGALGNVVSSAVMVPKELLTQRMQAGAGAHRRTLDLALHILREDGVFGLYAGYAATLLRNLPAGILSYSSFEYLKAFALRLTKKPHLEPAHSVACGALAGAISASLTTPLDVVKTRLMTQPQGEGSRKVFETMRQIVLEEGWAGLGRGIGPRVLHSACFAAIGYCAFETARLAILQWYIQQREKAMVKSAA